MQITLDKSSLTPKNEKIFQIIFEESVQWVTCAWSDGGSTSCGLTMMLKIKIQFELLVKEDEMDSTMTWGHWLPDEGDLCSDFTSTFDFREASSFVSSNCLEWWWWSSINRRQSKLLIKINLIMRVCWTARVAEWQHWSDDRPVAFVPYRHS